MQHAFKLIIALFAVLLAGPVHADDNHGSADEAVELVHKVIIAIKAQGRDKVIAQVNDIQSGTFRDRDLYITINDMNAKNLAHGANPRMQGKDLIELRDADGKAFMRERLALAKSKGKGWQEYKFVNPVTRQIEPKAMYFERFEDLIVNCGIYK